MASAPKTRTWMAAILDVFLAWKWYGLPRETCSYTVQRLRIPIGDSLELAANLYRPQLRHGARPVGTLLVRTPYGLEMSLPWDRVWAARGYQVLTVASRGTSGSDGKLDPCRYETEDGFAVVAWMRQQPWYTGSFATLGGSYLGFTQWALLTDPPGDMKAAVIESGLHSVWKWGWETGALSHVYVAWAMMMDGAYRDKQGPPKDATDESMRPILESMPLMDGIKTYFQGDPAPWVVEAVQRPDEDDPWHVARSVNIAFERAQIPILLFTGWYDSMRSQVMMQWARLSARGCPVSITIGPWNHLEALQLTKREEWDFLEDQFAHNPAARRRKSPVRVFITGASQWRDLDSWPPPVVASRNLHLSSNGTLSSTPPVGEESTSFSFNPEDPTPAMGTSTFVNLNGHKEDDARLAARDDVLSFTSEPLDSDCEVIGRPKVELFHSTVVPFADLLVRLSEVAPSGRSSGVAEGYMRLSTDRNPAVALQLELSDCAHRFRRHSRLRLLIAGGAHFQYVRNTGTGEPPANAKTLKTVVHTVRHGKAANSLLSLRLA